MGVQRTRLGVEGEEARELGWVRWSVVGFSPEGEEAIENLSGRVTGSGFSLEMPLWVSESSLRLGGRWWERSWRLAPSEVRRLALGGLLQEWCYAK